MCEKLRQESGYWCGGAGFEIFVNRLCGHYNALFSDQYLRIR